MLRSVSDPMLSSLTSRPSDALDGLSIHLSISQHTLVKPSDMNVNWDGQPSDIPLLVQLVSLGLAGAVKGSTKAGQRLRKRGRKLPFIGVSRLQTLMHLGRIRSSSSSSVPEMCRVCAYVCVCKSYCCNE